MCAAFNMSFLLLSRCRFLVHITVVAEVGHYDRCTWSGWLLSDLYLYEEAGYEGFGLGDQRGWYGGTVANGGGGQCISCSITTDGWNTDGGMGVKMMI